MKIRGNKNNLSLTLVVASCIPTLFLLTSLSYTIMQSADAQRLPPLAEQERLIEESTPQLIEELAGRGGFLMPVEDIREILEIKEKTAGKYHLFHSMSF